MKKTHILTFILISLVTSSFAQSAAKPHKKKHHHHHAKTTKVVKSNQQSAKLNYTTPIPRITTPPTIPQEKIDQDAISNQPRLYSYSAIALNANTGNVVVSKNPTTKMPIASITKLMTAMVALDSQDNLDEYVTISAEDIDTLRNTFSRLKVGMQLRRRDLLLLALMSSENRAAHALARTSYVGGTHEFIQKMNEKAKTLGMIHTQFYDPTGLTTTNQSTAEDLTKMVQAAFEYQLIKDDTTTKGADIAFSPRYVHHYINSDALVRIGKFPIYLSKTGFINEAGHCLVLYSMIDSKPIIMVFLNSAGKSGRLIDAIAVKNYIQKLS